MSRGVALRSAPSVWPNPDPTANGTKPVHAFPNSIWTTPLPMTLVQHPASSTLVANLLSSNAVALSGPNRVASRYVVPGKSVPKMKVHVNPGSRNWNSAPSGTVQVPFPNPDLLRPAQWNTDREVIIRDTDNNLVWNFWVFCNDLYGQDASGAYVANPDGSWTCNTFQLCPTDGSYSGVGNWASDPTGLSTTTSAAGFPYEASVITVADMLYVQNGGSIDHALFIAVNQTGASVWPASSYDGSWGAGSLPEGVLFTWAPGTVKPTGLSLLGSALYDAVTNFGVYVGDMAPGAGTNLAGENPSTWWEYAPGGSYQPYLAGLLNWANDQDNQGRPILPASWPYGSLVAVTPRLPTGIINNMALPAAPTGLTATPNANHSVTLSWTAPSTWGGGFASGYYVIGGTASGSYWPMGSNNGGGGAGPMQVTVNSSTTSWTATNEWADNSYSAFTSGQHYYFRVCACSSAGMGPASSEVAVTTI